LLKKERILEADLFAVLPYQDFIYMKLLSLIISIISLCNFQFSRNAEKLMFDFNFAEKSLHSNQKSGDEGENFCALILWISEI